MEIRVFNENRKANSIHFKDILIAKMVNRRLCYLTEDGFFYGPVNLKEFAELHENFGMAQIDKNNVVNLYHIQYVIKGEAYIKGKKYTVSRRRRAKLNERWDKRTM